MKHEKVMYVTCEEFNELRQLPIDPSENFNVPRNPSTQVAVSIMSKRAEAQKKEFKRWQDESMQ